jgi:hypothetical protein
MYAPSGINCHAEATLPCAWAANKYRDVRQAELTLPVLRAQIVQVRPLLGEESRPCYGSIFLLSDSYASALKKPG